MKANKKGVSLAFVIVVVLALVILSSLLFTAAAHSVSMTGRSTDGRAAYLKAKSAIEYAKTEVYNLAKSNSLTAFSVGPNGDYFQPMAAQAPNGTTCLAECAPAADGKTWKVTAKVKYSGFEQYRQMSYSFTLERNIPASDYIMCGAHYGLQSVFTDGFHPTFYSSAFNIFSQGKSDYPVVENLPVEANVNYGYLSAPEAFFCGMSASSSYDLSGKSVVGSSIVSNNVRTTIHSDMIGIAGDISGVTYYLSDRSYLYLQSYTGSAGGVIYFNGQNGGTAHIVNFMSTNDGITTEIVNISKGYYWFDSDIDLFDLQTSGSGFIDSANHRLVPLTEHEAALSSDQQAAEKKKNAAYEQDTDYIMANSANMMSGDSWDSYRGLNWAPGGILALGWPSHQSIGHWWSHEDHVRTDDKTVFLYVKKGQAWTARETTDTYCAKQIFLQFVGDGVFSRFGITEANNLTFPNNGTVNFQADLISINMMKTDTNGGGSVTDRPAIVQPNPNEWWGATPAQFIVKSLDGSSNVTLVFPKDVGVNYYQKTGDTYQPASYVIPQGIYSVESGFDFFAGPINWAAYRTGTPGGFTITPGQYSVS